MKVLDPGRGKYRKKIGKLKVCEFCNKKNIKKQECKTLSSEYWRVFINIYPYMDGNLMLIPKRHIKEIEEISENEWMDFFLVLKNTKKKLTRIFKTRDFNVAINIGKNSGGSIEHMHWQIIPRKYLTADNSFNIFSDIQVITILPAKLKEMIDKA